jgi:glycosyltransferase involved in cell wall biosynthesis
MYKCPIVATIHATEVGRWRSEYLTDGLSQSIDRVEKDLSFEAWRVIACSHYMVGELRRHFKLPVDKLDMIPNGINLDIQPHFDPDELAAFRAGYVLSDDPLIFSVGRLVFEKGHHVLLGAMPQILASFPRARLVLAGKGPLRGYLQNIVDSLGITDNVQFAGFITDLERDKFLSVADCAIFPSLYEPFGIVALEAMAFNCPIVVSNLGGFAEVVQHEKTGILIYPDNSDSAAWGILQVLKKPLLAQSYADNARKMIEEDYNWHHVAHETIKVFERVISERAATVW